MVILKKIVIMTEHNKSNCSGIVKFENFAGRTSCFVRILGLKGNAVICIKCGEDIMYLGNLFDGEHKFNALYDLNRIIQIIVVSGGSVVCMGSNRGRFSPSALMNDIGRYYMRTAQNVDNTTNAMEDNTQITVEQNPIQSNFQRQEIDSKSTNEPSAVIIDIAQETLDEVEQIDNREENEIKASETKTHAKNVEKEEKIIRVEQTQKPKQEKKVSQTKAAEPFYKKIEKNLSELFEAHEKDEELTLLIPESKWVRVPIEGDGYYVVGLIESEGVPNIICYGVPDKDSSNPPQNSSDCRQWLEIEKGGRGYWLMYQSAVSGETLTTTIV